MGYVRLPRVQVHPLRALQAENVEDAPLHRGQDVEYPDRRGNIQVDKVKEADPRRAKPQVQAHGIAEQGERRGPRNPGYLREIGVQSIDAEQDECECKPQPHRLIGKKRSPNSSSLLALNHFHRHLHQRIRQLLPIYPLLAQDDHRANHRRAECQEEAVPIGQRQHPRAPRNGNSLGQPLKKVARHVFAARDHPRGNVLVV